MSKSKHANSLVGKRIRLLTGDRKTNVVDVLGVVYTMNLAGGSQEEIVSYYEDLKDFMVAKFGFNAYVQNTGGLRLVVKIDGRPATITVPRKNHYVVL